ncbi:MAG TPA: hypothetical protein VEQ87_15570 [Burkholderiales bacterium]|nr:hypothetical protein [Burkholderiales bacterium]
MRKKHAQPKPLPESREELLAELEQLTGRKFRTQRDVRDFVALFEAEKSGQVRRASGFWRTVKNATLLVLLLFAVVQFYFTDTLLQMVSLRENTFFVPVKAIDVRSGVPLPSTAPDRG